MGTYSRTDPSSLLDDDESTSDGTRSVRRRVSYSARIFFRPALRTLASAIAKTSSELRRRRQGRSRVGRTVPDQPYKE